MNADRQNLVPSESQGKLMPSADTKVIAIRSTNPTLHHPFTLMPQIQALRRLSFMLPLFLLALCGTAQSSPQWPQFRGPNGSGVAADAKPPIKIGPTNGVLWKVEVPWSPASPCVWDDRIFLTTLNDGELQTRCHSTADGKLLWAHGVKPKELELFHR